MESSNRDVSMRGMLLLLGCWLQVSENSFAETWSKTQEPQNLDAIDAPMISYSLSRLQVHILRIVFQERSLSSHLAARAAAPKEWTLLSDETWHVSGKESRSKLLPNNFFDL